MVVLVVSLGTGLVRSATLRFLISIALALVLLLLLPPQSGAAPHGRTEVNVVVAEAALGEVRRVLAVRKDLTDSTSPA